MPKKICLTLLSLAAVSLSSANLASAAVHPAVPSSKPNLATTDSDWLEQADREIAAGQFQDSLVDKLASAVDKSPNDPRLHRMLGEVLALRGYEQLAYEQFLLASRKDPNYILNLFHQRLQKQAPGNPFTMLAAARQMYPQDSGVVFAQAVHKFKANQPEQALYLFRKAANMKEPWPHSLAVLAEFEAGLGMWNEASEHAKKQLQIDPQDTQALSVELRCALHAGRPLGSMQSDLESAYKKNPSDPFLASMLARSYVSNHKYDQAIEPALRALIMPYGEQNPPAEDVVNQVYQHVSAKAFDDGVAHALSEIQNGTYRPYFYLKLAQLYDRNGRHKEAHTQLTAAALSGEAALDTRLALDLADTAQHEFQDYSLAYRFYSQALNRAPGNTKARLASECIVRRVANYPNDLAWQLKAAIWNCSELIPKMHRQDNKRPGSAKH